MSPRSSNINATSITVMWDAPSSGSAQILRYPRVYLLLIGCRPSPLSYFTLIAIPFVRPSISAIVNGEGNEKSLKGAVVFVLFVL